ncbi:O-acyltransferase like protein-like [Argopecten irradians]|uniref:O-acyltransferase like protein-like n=1 Tax=Argopecten irradians TaxID=31199 RepID=UPI003720BFAB
METCSSGFFILIGLTFITALLPRSLAVQEQDLTHAEKAAFIADYLIQHELQSHYVYESITASKDLVQEISSRNKSSATPELVNALSSYALMSFPSFLREKIVQDITGILVDEAVKALHRTNITFNSTLPLSHEDIQQISSEYNYVQALTRSITIAKPLIEQYRQENDSTICIILLNKAIEMTSYIVSTPTFQTVMDIVIDELSQGFLKSDLPERITAEGTEFLDDTNNTFSIVQTVIESSNIERLISRSYIASKPALDTIYQGDTLFLYTTLLRIIGLGSKGSVENLVLKVVEADFLKTYNDKYNGDITYLLNDPQNTYKNVIQEMNVLRLLPFSSGGARMMLSYNSSTAKHKINEACYEDTMGFIDAAINQEDWTLSFLDAQGKLPSGISGGNWNNLGDMDQCLNVKPEIKSNSLLRSSNRAVGTKYCRVRRPYDFIKSIPEVKNITRFTLGLCVPDSCTESDVYGLLKLDAFGNLTADLLPVHCHEEDDLSQDLLTLFVLILIGCIAFLTFSGTVYVAIETRGIIRHESNNLEEEKSNVALNDPQGKDTTPSCINVRVETNGKIKEDNPCPGRDTIDHCKTSCNGTDQLNDTPNHKEWTNGSLQKTENENKNKEGVLVAIMKAFALQINVPKIMKTQLSPNSIGCLHGLRPITISWSILIHSYLFGLTKDFRHAWTIANPETFANTRHRFIFQGVIGSNFAVDTFFVMSGMLLTYTQMKYLAKMRTKLNGRNLCQYIFLYFFRRLFRLTPVYVMTLLINYALLPKISSGPIEPGVYETNEFCDKYWWTNLLYVNNIVKPIESCMSWSWYLANDMQFFVLSLPLLLIMMFQLQIGIVLSAMLIIAGMVYTGWMQYHIVGGNWYSVLDRDRIEAYWTDIYVFPLGRIGAYMIGFLFGIFLQKRTRRSTSKIVGFVGWTMATGVALTLVYVVYDFNKEEGEPWTSLQNACYEAVSRPAWAMCICWVIFACYNYMGGPVNAFLSWKGLIPLSRLTYSVYLIHPLVMQLRGYSAKSILYYSDFDMIYLHLANLVLSFPAAFIVSVTLESPFIAIEKILLE